MRAHATTEIDLAEANGLGVALELMVQLERAATTDDTDDNQTEETEGE